MYTGLVFISKFKKYLSKDLFDSLMYKGFIQGDDEQNKLFDFGVSEFYSFNTLKITLDQLTNEYWTIDLLNEIMVTGAPRKFKNVRALDGTVLTIPINKTLKEIYGNCKRD